MTTNNIKEKVIRKNKANKIAFSLSDKGKSEEDVFENVIEDTGVFLGDDVEVDKSPASKMDMKYVKFLSTIFSKDYLSDNCKVELSLDKKEKVDLISRRFEGAYLNLEQAYKAYSLRELYYFVVKYIFLALSILVVALTLLNTSNILLSFGVYFLIIAVLSVGVKFDFVDNRNLNFSFAVLSCFFIFGVTQGVYIGALLITFGLSFLIYMISFVFSQRYKDMVYVNSRYLEEDLAEIRNLNGYNRLAFELSFIIDGLVKANNTDVRDVETDAFIVKALGEQYKSLDKWVAFGSGVVTDEVFNNFAKKINAKDFILDAVKADILEY